MKCTNSATICPKSVKGQAGKKLLYYFILAILCFSALILSPRLNAQATGSFSGNVLDKAGSALPGATVTATSDETGLARETKTDTGGHYLIPLLPVGTYTVRVDSAGFQSAESKGIHLQVDQARELDFSVVPATVVTSVAVTGEAVAVETGNPSLGQVITAQQVSQLPLNGRDFVQLATLTAGATAESNPNSFFTSGSDSEVAARGSYSLSVGGSRPNATDWLLDGVDNNELTAGGSAFSRPSTTSRNSRSFPTPTPPNSAPAPALPSSSPQSQVPTTSMAQSSSSFATPTSTRRATLPAPWRSST